MSEILPEGVRRDEKGNLIFTAPEHMPAYAARAYLDPADGRVTVGVYQIQLDSYRQWGYAPSPLTPLLVTHAVALRDALDRALRDAVVITGQVNAERNRRDG